VQLRRTDAHLHLEVRCEHTEFPSHAGDAPHVFRTLRTWVHHLHGAIDIDGGSGTCIEVRLPLRPSSLPPVSPPPSLHALTAPPRRARRRGRPVPRRHPENYENVRSRNSVTGRYRVLLSPPPGRSVFDDSRSGHFFVLGSIANAGNCSHR
jgi:hypothetical protein